MTRVLRGLMLGLLLVLAHNGLQASKKKKVEKTQSPKQETGPALLSGMAYRLIGPFRGGRSAAVCGVPEKPTTYYMGGTGGGVWRTQDGGSTWKNISDGFFGGSIGAVAVSEWDSNVIYVGGGEKTVRGNVSHGDGMYRSVDGGTTWQHIGLEDSRHIPRIRIHPKNPERVYAAVMGHLYGPNEQRGVYRTTDGGASWENVLFVSKEAGAVDLCMDPTNPRILYASFWNVKRTPYSLTSGGPGSSLWKTTDGGDTWTEISTNKGMPAGTLGIIGVAVSPQNGQRVWAMVEAAEGGLFRSEDGGKTWARINEQAALRQRAWYYTRLYADSLDEDTVYVLNVRFWKSTDGGKQFESISTPHGDHHDLWLDPKDPKRMIVGDDGGGQVSFDGGQHWSTYRNQPTAQFYRVTTDNYFPYRIYGAQQDNSTVRIGHRNSGSRIGNEDWEATAGGESGHIAPHPNNPDIVYGGSYDGYLSRYNHETKQVRNVQVWPDNPMGHGAAELKYRFQWNFPIFFSPHDAGTLYAAGNVLFKSDDEGQSWTTISKDLTTNDKSKQGSSGGPITKDNTSVEYYSTIFAAAESQHEPGVIWTGSDDGLVYLTRDGGESWQNVTPTKLPKWTQINSIEIHPSEKGGLYLAGTRYKSDDFAPYLYKTTNYGQTWKKITTGIDPNHFTRVIRADPKRAGLLYAGTESGIYFTMDDGKQWQSLQLNLPTVPITDMVVKEDDLVVATQGRSFWVLDDLTPLHQMKSDMDGKQAVLFAPRKTWRIRGTVSEQNDRAGENLQGGVLVHFYLPQEPAMKEESEQAKVKSEETDKRPLSLDFLDEAGQTLRSYSSMTTEAEAKEGSIGRVEAKQGFNRFVWDLRLPEAETFEGMIVWSGQMQGPRVVPGVYQVRLTYGEYVKSQTFKLEADPRTGASRADLQRQFDFLVAVRDKLSETHRAIKQIRKVREQIQHMIKPMKEKGSYPEIVAVAEAIEEKMHSVETTLYQTKSQSRQDPLNYPVRLNDKLAGLNSAVGRGDFPPTDQAIAVRAELVAEIDAELAKLKQVFEQELPDLNQLIHHKDVATISLE